MTLWQQLLMALGTTVVVNEVLYDPEGTDTGREFVEILNTSDVPVPLAGLGIEVGDGARVGAWRSTWQGTTGEIDPGGFLLVSGDSIASDFRLETSLQNGPDAVRLVRDGEVLDRVGYGALVHAEYYESRPAPDVSGSSLARIPDGIDTDDNAADFEAAPPTPGRRNRPLRAWRVELARPDPTRSWPGRHLRAVCRVRNIGMGLLEAGAWSLRARLVQVHGEPYRGETQPGVSFPIDVRDPATSLSPGDSLHYEIAWTGSGGLFELMVEAHGADEDSSDNQDRAYVRVGAGPLIVNEILFAPEVGSPEWIEIWNRDGVAHDLDRFTLADASDRPARLRAPRLLAPGAYAVVSGDTLEPLAGLAPGALRVAAVPWPSLNNTDGTDGFADVVLLRDDAGVVHDALRYSASWGGERGRSLERLIEDPDVGGLLWAPSKDARRSTPGRANSASGPPPPRLDLEITPNPFSPDGDGRDDRLGIALQVPDGFEGLRLSVFDLAGRRRRTLAADRLGPGPRRLVWEGEDENGIGLPEGVYVLSLELYSKSRGALRSRRVLGIVRP